MSSTSYSIPHASSLLLAVVLALTLVGVPISFATVASGFDDGYGECCSREADSERSSKSTPCLLVSCPCGLCAPIVMTGKATSIVAPHEQATLSDSFPESCLQGISMLVERPPETA
ncbi:hypothetical protein [Desulfonatronum thiosulfatophilum]|uniref:hypothetical protein n=1 Tax=Desulfonatronum thiosulfatophilum TaxID=617002 RepID=UPI001113DB5E|nr:hypothetical protein [Desulfonatronum thiosulfatophilum]